MVIKGICSVQVSVTEMHKVGFASRKKVLVQDLISEPDKDNVQRSEPFSYHSPVRYSELKGFLKMSDSMSLKI